MVLARVPGEDASTARLKLGVIRNQATSAQGDGLVMSLRFKPLATGTADLRIVTARPVGLTGPVPEPALPAPIALVIK